MASRLAGLNLPAGSILLFLSASFQPTKTRRGVLVSREEPSGSGVRIPVTVSYFPVAADEVGLADLVMKVEILASMGIAAPIQAGKRWVVERTHSWINGYCKLRRVTGRDDDAIEFHTFLAAAIAVIRSLIRQARTRYRWDARPTTRRLP